MSDVEEEIRAIHERINVLEAQLRILMIHRDEIDRRAEIDRRVQLIAEMVDKKIMEKEKEA